MLSQMNRLSGEQGHWIEFAMYGDDHTFNRILELVSTHVKINLTERYLSDRS